MSEEAKKAKVEISNDGPFIVTGNVPLNIETIAVNEQRNPDHWEKGTAFPAEETMYLCRCGHSKNKPYCDDSHVTVQFDGAETAGFESFNEQAEKFDGEDLILLDGKSFCASARFCNLGGGIRNLVSKSSDPEAKALAISESQNCPAGRLVLVDKKTGQKLEQIHEPSISIVEDPDLNISGPLYLKGDIEVVSADGKSYEKRNRVTLCRCGASGNKPFCDGSHIRARFKDGL